MARYKDYNHDQSKLIPISFSRQILPGSFEYTLSHPIDHLRGKLKVDIQWKLYNIVHNLFKIHRYGMMNG